jgi:alkylation response protein AidB-like acyl-CoA dehydrogenase
MDFQITAEATELQARARRLAAEFATRAAAHDREASSPMENYAALRREGFYELNVPKDRGGAGIGLLPWSLAVEELAQGCPATALAFNMHLSIVGPLMEIAAVPEATKSYIADLVVKQRKLIAGNFSEPQTSGLAASHGRPATRARHVEGGGYRVNGKKAFASMVEASDYCALLARPEETEAPTAGILVLIPSDAPGRRIEHVWDTLGMRATRSENVLLEDCWIPEEGGLYSTEDFPSFIRDGANWLWASYTAVYLGVGAAAYKEVVKVLKGRIPPGYVQPLAYHPDVRRRVAEMSVDLEAARLMVYNSAWLSDTQGPTQAALAAMFRAKYFVGEAVSRITRTALTLGGAHAIFKTSPLERFFRDGATAPIQFPPGDFCLGTVGMLELGLDATQMLPPLKRP